MKRALLFTMRISEAERALMGELAKRLRCGDVAELLRGLLTREERRQAPGAGRLCRVTITVRDDGRFDVTRERSANGETFKGLRSLAEVYEVIDIATR